MVHHNISTANRSPLWHACLVHVTGIGVRVNVAVPGAGRMFCITLDGVFFFASSLSLLKSPCCSRCGGTRTPRAPPPLTCARAAVNSVVVMPDPFPLAAAMSDLHSSLWRH